jgi:signal peptidase I
MPVVRWIGRLGVWVAIGMLAGLLLAVAAPIAIDWRPYTVLTGSMRPVIQPGDVVMDEPVTPIQARPGDVITFPDPQKSRLVTHRVKSMKVADGRASFVTQGDANNIVEKWQVPVDQTLGRVVYKIPKVGHLAVWSAKPTSRLLLIVGPALLIGAVALVRIWRAPPDEPARGPTTNAAA